MRRRAIVPARLNIIGEHTDYAGGLSLSLAIKPELTLDVTLREDGYIGDSVIVQLWKAAGGGPAELTVASNIPIGKGMSSSAALCVAIVTCANGVVNNLETCLEAQRIEHQVLQTPCGLLDQMAMVFANKDMATLIDFNSNSVEYAPIRDDWRFKLVDSGIHRKLTDVYRIESSRSEIHVSQENERVKSALNSNAITLGKLLNESHESLRGLGVSTTEIDEQVKALQHTQGVLGARMMGGGFGGMILVLVEGPEVLPDIPLVQSSGPVSFEKFL